MNVTSGIKHLIECHCSLAIFNGKKNIIYHKFPVYSKLDKNNEIISKIVQCNNCNVVHKVSDYCKSEIMGGKDELTIGLTVEDISLQLDPKVSNILTIHNCDIATWEHVLDIFEGESWGEQVVLGRQIIESKQNLKLLQINANGKVRISNHIIEDEIVGEGLYENR